MQFTETLWTTNILIRYFLNFSTPLLSDACLRLGIPIRLAPVGIFSLIYGSHISGRALPVRHYGSVDIFLEAMGAAQSGDILVIDNNGRKDEGCIGDLTALEAQACKLAGIVVFGGATAIQRSLKRLSFPYSAMVPALLVLNGLIHAIRIHLLQQILGMF